MRLFNLFFAISLCTAAVGQVPRLLLPENAGPHGLPGIPPQAESLSLGELEADLVVLVVFDLYCPVCQKSAANMKRLGESVLGSESDIPVLGIGSGDTPFETKTFKDKFELPFLCISDREETVSGYYRVERTPSVIVLAKSDEGKSLTEIYRIEGYLGREHIQAIITLLKEET